MTKSGAARLAIRNGRPGFVLGEETILESPRELYERQWAFLGLGLDASAGLVKLAWGQLGRTGGPYELVRTIAPLPPPTSDGTLVLGGHTESEGWARGQFDGKLHAPFLLAEIPDAIGLMELMNWGIEGTSRRRAILGSWLFGSADSLWKVVDQSANNHHGTLINAPALGVSGPLPLDGTTEPPMTAAPYATVHLHRDDLESCRWPRTHRIAVPESARSGFYSLHVSGSDGDAELPFIVTPEVNPLVLLLAPTFTWQAYANLGREADRYPGLSHYALHNDGSPVYVTTRLKPSPTLEPGARLEVDSVDAFTGTGAPGDEATATHLLMADLYANYWLDRSGIDFGVVTDGVLHENGARALRGARVLVLSAHPEYWTAAMLDAVEHHLDAGGSLIYLGGNGLYWVTSIDHERPHLMEVRRWRGSQTWSAERDEVAHVFEPQWGGTWAQSGRPPDSIVSVGFAGFGWDTGIGYQRTDASYGPDFAWVFDGVTSAVIGECGLNMGGAVAFEFDRYTPDLAPVGTTVLASAMPTGGFFFRTFESGPGRAPDVETRADMTIRHTPAGGIVFSLGSVTASGCLPVEDGKNDLARVCTNVLQRMLA
ncbi:MAG: dmfA2 [Acidimicrobiaceae bacterium]|nr:dmfA2 [Acidimicrobiaceae bacterium]